jgi:hypothetical protein
LRVLERRRADDRDVLVDRRRAAVRGVDVDPAAVAEARRQLARRGVDREDLLARNDQQARAGLL